MKNSTLKRVLVATAAGAALAGSAQAATVWDNGGPGGLGFGCSSNSACGGSFGWTVYDDFSLASATTVTGFTYDSDFKDIGSTTQFGSASHYVSTNWSVWSSDPLSNFAAGPSVSGASVGANTADSLGLTTTTVTGLNLALAAGTYWLGLQNNVDNGQVTTYVASGASRLGPPRLADNAGNFATSSFEDAAFTVQGSVPQPVPEPASWVMMLIGFGGLGAAIRSSRRKPARATA